MKRLILPALLALCLLPAFSQNLTGLDQWIIGLPRGQTSLAGRPITRCVVERTGAMAVVDRGGLDVTFTLLKPVPLETLAARFAAVEKALLDPNAQAADRWNIGLTSCEISFGLKDEVRVGLAFQAFRVRLNQGTILELEERLEAEPVFTWRAQDDAFVHSLRFRGIAYGAGERRPFPGWAEYATGLAAWFVKALEEDNQAVMAIVIDTKVMSLADKRAQKRIVLSKDTRTNLWVGMDLGLLTPHLVCAEDEGVTLYPGGYDVFQPMVYLSWRNLGDKEWLAKPFQVSIAAGGFFEVNARYLQFPGEFRFLGFPGTSPMSFTFAFGPAVSAEFTAMIPRIIDNKYTGDLLGLGIELLTQFNVPYFFTDYYYEYFLTQYVNLVLHIIPVDGAGWDLVLGIDFTLATPSFDEAQAGLVLDKFGVTVGTRLKIDFQNFYVTNALYN